MAKSTKRGRGRPPVDNPKKLQLNVRIDEELRQALEAYRRRDELDDLSTAARAALKTFLRSEELMK